MAAKKSKVKKKASTTARQVKAAKGRIAKAAKGKAVAKGKTKAAV